MNNKILIVGKGELGRALERVLSKNENNRVTLWGKSPELPKSEVVFMAVPTSAVTDVTEKVKNTQQEKTILVILSKGLSKNGKTPWELARNVWRGRQVIISGPMIAEELVDDKIGLGLVAGDSDQAIDKIIRIFENTNLRLQAFKDIVGLSWCGPLKNLYAIGLGIAEAENKGLNYKGWYVQQATKEMAVIIGQLGGQKATAFTIAGLGDLIATGFSPDSSNFQLGRELIKDQQVIKGGEGVTVAKGLSHRLPEDFRGQITTNLISKFDREST